MENNHVKLSQSLEDYLEMVHMLRLANGIARVKDIAAALSVKMPSGIWSRLAISMILSSSTPRPLPSIAVLFIML